MSYTDNEKQFLQLAGELGMARSLHILGDFFDRVTTLLEESIGVRLDQPTRRKKLATPTPRRGKAKTRKKTGRPARGTYAELLKKFRREKKVGIPYVAKKLGIPQEKLASIEQGDERWLKPDVRKAIRDLG